MSRNKELKMRMSKIPMIWTTEEVSKAAELGRAAFHNGRKCIPVHDSELVAMISRIPPTAPMGSAIPALKAWRDAFMELAAAPMFPQGIR